MKLKRLGAVLMASVMLVSLAGCGTGKTETQSGTNGETTGAATAAEKSQVETQSQAAAGGESVTIKFMHDWPEYETEFNQMVADFEKANPDIKIETQIITWDILTQTLMTAFASGEVPDVSCCWLDQMGGFNSMGAVLDLTEYMEADGGAWKNTLLSPAVELGTVNSQILGCPYRTTCTILAYNKTMMEENGWKVPETREELIALMDQVVEKGGITPMLAPGNPDGFQIASLTKTLAEHELYKNGKLQTNEYLTGHMSGVGAEYETAGDMMKEWIEKGYVDTNSLAQTREEATALFYTQKGLFSFVNNNELAAIEENCKEAGFEPGFMAFPSPEGMPSILYNFGVDGFMVYSGTKYPEQSVRWLKYITSRDVQQKFGLETLSIMANKECVYENENQNEFVKIFSNGKSFRINFDYQSGKLLTDENNAIGGFIADSAKTGADLAKEIVALKEKCIEENAN